MTTNNEIPDWQYYGFNSEEEYTEGEGCGVVGCCIPELLTRDERKKLINIREDYLFMLTENPGATLRDEDPKLWHSIVDQWEAVKLRLEDDEHERIMQRTTKNDL